MLTTDDVTVFVSLLSPTHTTADIFKISQKRYNAAGINFLQPLSAWAQQARKIDTRSTSCVDITFH